MCVYIYRYMCVRACVCGRVYFYDVVCGIHTALDELAQKGV